MSKFVEILDNEPTPYSHDNVSLEAVLAETRERSASTSSTQSTDSLSSEDRSTSPASPSPAVSQVKMRLRALSLRRKS